ncbi:helix-turn-helix domain-containing protein [Enterococcus sp. DIV0170]|uniref:helix-turn-helix domain-containing protein n=1 Tax=Enterococcus sp. DIV0170 TaxID=2774642 RepID=UPI003F27FEBE
MISLRTKLMRLIDSKGWSQAELARRADISPQQISYYLKGDREPSKDNIKKIAKAFDIQTDFFLDDIASADLLDSYLEFGVYEGYDEAPEISKNDTPEYFAIQRKSKKLNQKDQQRLLKIMEATFDDLDNGDFEEDDDDDL